MEDLVTLIVKTYGLVGAILLSPFIAVYFLWKELKATRESTLAQRNTDTDKFNNTINSLSERLIKVQEQRVADVSSISEKMMVIISEQSAVSRETNMALERVGDFLVDQQIKGGQK